MLVERHKNGLGEMKCAIVRPQCVEIPLSDLKSKVKSVRMATASHVNGVVKHTSQLSHSQTVTQETATVPLSCRRHQSIMIHAYDLTRPRHIVSAQLCSDDFVGN